MLLESVLGVFCHWQTIVYVVPKYLTADPCLLICQVQPLGYFITKLMHLLFIPGLKDVITKMIENVWLQCISSVSAYEEKGRVYVMCTDSDQCSIDVTFYEFSPGLRLSFEYSSREIYFFNLLKCAHVIYGIGQELLF